MSAAEIIDHYRLEALQGEGGYFARFYTSAEVDPQGRRLASAIYYLITRESFSAIHRLASDELFHFYEGHAVEMLQLSENGEGRLLRLGTDYHRSEQRAVLVPRGCWQGLRLPDDAPKGAYAFFGVSVHPEFRWEEFILGDRDTLCSMYPQWRQNIERLTNPAFEKSEGLGFQTIAS
jgi:hypothetical protein